MKNDSGCFCGQHTCHELLLTRKAGKLLPVVASQSYTGLSQNRLAILYFTSSTLYMELNREGMSHGAGSCFSRLVQARGNAHQGVSVSTAMWNKKHYKLIQIKNMLLTKHLCLIFTLRFFCSRIT